MLRFTGSINAQLEKQDSSDGNGGKSWYMKRGKERGRDGVIES